MKKRKMPIGAIKYTYISRSAGRSGIIVPRGPTSEDGNDLAASIMIVRTITESAAKRTGVRPRIYLYMKPLGAGWVVKRTGP